MLGVVPISSQQAALGSLDAYQGWYDGASRRHTCLHRPRKGLSPCSDATQCRRSCAYSSRLGPSTWTWSSGTASPHYENLQNNQKSHHRSLQHTSETTAPARSEVAALPIRLNCSPHIRGYCTAHQGLVQPTSEVTAPHARGYCFCQITLICPHRGSLRACCCSVTSHLTVAVVYMQPQSLTQKHSSSVASR